MKGWRFIASLMAAVMLIGLMPVFGLSQSTAYAAETAETEVWDLTHVENNDAYRKVFAADRDRKAVVTSDGTPYQSYVPQNCYDGNLSTFWYGLISGSAKKNVNFKFEEPEQIGRVVYSAHSSGAGFAAEFEIWGAETDDDELTLITSGSYAPAVPNGSTNRIVISFPERTFKKLSFVWKKVTGSSYYFIAGEISFWKADPQDGLRRQLETDLKGLFMDSSCSALAYGVTEADVKALEEQVNEYPVPELFKHYIDAAYNLLGLSGRGEDVHEPITLSQRGERGTEANRVGTHYQIGGQYDITGYYARPGETIGVYASYDPNGPVPKIVLATANQDKGAWYYGWNGSNLKNGYNEFTLTGMKGCQLIYFYNPALPSDQAYPPVVQFTGGTKYPVYRYNSNNPELSDDPDAFMRELEEYVSEVNDIDAEVESGSGKYNVCELVSDFMVATTSAKGGLKGLETSTTWDKGWGANNRTYSGPKDVMELWDQMLRDDYYTYIGYNMDDPTHADYRPRPAFLWRVYTNGAGLAWAQSVYAAFNASAYDSEADRDDNPWDDFAYTLHTSPNTILSAGWGTYHELGHVVDSAFIGKPESTNNLFALSASLKYGDPKKTRMHTDNRWYNHFTNAINTGVFGDGDLIYYPATIIFQLESIDFSKTKLYPEIESLYGSASRYARLHRDQLNGLSYDDKLILCLSMGAGVDLSGHFAVFNHPASDNVKWLLRDLKQETRPLHYANDRTWEGEGFNDAQKAQTPEVTVSSGSSVTLTMKQDTYKKGDDPEGKNLQCYEISRRDITDPNNPVPEKPEFIGITGDNLKTKENEIYTFTDRNVSPGHTYEYTVTAYDCDLMANEQVWKGTVSISKNAVIPITWLGINGVKEGSATMPVNGELKIQLGYTPSTATYDFNCIEWDITDKNKFSLEDDPDYPGDPTHKVLKSKGSGSTEITIEVGGDNTGHRPAQGYGRDDNGYFITRGLVTAKLTVTTQGTTETAMTGLSFNKDSIQLKPGQTTVLSLIKEPLEATNTREPEWFSTDESVARIATDGTVTAVGNGTATVSASIIDSVSGGVFTANCEVTVDSNLELPEPQSIKIDSWASAGEEYPVLYSGDINFHQMSISVEPSNASFNPKNVKWTVVSCKGFPDWVKDPTWVADFDMFGKGRDVLGAYGGVSGFVTVQATLTLSDGTELTATLDVEVSEERYPKLPIALRTLDIDNTSVTIKEGAKKELNLIPDPADAAYSEKILWKSSDTDIVTVEKSSTDPKKASITAIKPGTANITGIWSGKQVVCRVTVTGDIELENLQFQGMAAGANMTREMTEGRTYQLMLYPIPANATSLSSTEWVSSDADIASVDGKRGLVTAVKPGTAVITGKVTQTIDGVPTEKTLTCTVTVKANIIPLTGVSISQANHRMKLNEILTLTLSPRPFNANTGFTEITWVSSDVSIAEVDENGVVTPKSGGTVTITGAMGGFTQSCTVVVDPVLAKVQSGEVVDDDKTVDAAIGFKTDAITFNTPVTDFAWVLTIDGIEGRYGIKPEVNTTIVDGEVIFGLIVTGRRDWLEKIQTAELTSGIRFGDKTLGDVFGKSKTSIIIE
ncbi:MAG: Ig-like domain-containing protein [Oscillospiraceae bacterium]|nr:Ig-like domain-containing protein [Oscillospiraceae bacterium]